MRIFFLMGRVEVLRQLRRRSLYVVVTGLAALAWFSAALGTSDLVARRETYAKQLADLAHEQVRPRSTLIGSVVEPVLRAVRSPELGSLVARGEDLTVPPYFDFGPAGSVWARSVSSDATQLHAGLLLDLEAIIRVLGGFLAVLLGVETVASARTSGLIRAWTALGADPASVILGRLFGSSAVVTLAGLVVVGAATVSASLRLPEETTAIVVVFSRALVPVLLYLVGFAVVGGAWAVWSKDQPTALLGSVTFWIVATMVWPQVVTLGARGPLSTVLRVSIEADRDQAFRDEISVGEDAVGEAVFGWAGPVSAKATSDAMDRKRDELNAQWLVHTQVARAAAEAVEGLWRRDQARLANFNRLRVLSPGTAFLQSMTTLSGTGPTLAERWQAAIDEQQQRLNLSLFDDRPQITLRVPADDAHQMMRFIRHTGPRWQDLPAFTSPVITAGEVWSSATSPLAALLGYLAVAGLAVAVGGRRYPR